MGHALPLGEAHPSSGHGDIFDFLVAMGSDVTLQKSQAGSRVLQGYLAHKKQPPSLGPPYGPVESYGGKGFYGRGTPERKGVCSYWPLEE